MKNTCGIPQLILRLALGAGFLLPVMDRLGVMGPYGAKGVTWGDWQHFVDYTNTLIPFAGRQVANLAGLLATIAEAVFGVCLVAGLKTREVALGAGILTLVFGLCMAFFVSIRAPFSYPVFVFTGGALVLSTVDDYRWSVDHYLRNRQRL